MEKALLVLLETTSFKMGWKGGLEVGQRITLLPLFTWRTRRYVCGDLVISCVVVLATCSSPDPLFCRYALYDRVACFFDSNRSKSCERAKFVCLLLCGVYRLVWIYMYVCYIFLLSSIKHALFLSVFLYS
jgi:hypothetical protein